ncbi:MAG: choice-of-anchor D domain-containing protein [Chloroflexi bacterium]|nr:MAG: choice-of-anchor D domain-containing protein [Chloroflexota bacterium]
MLLTVSMQVRPGPATPRVGVNAQVTLTPEVVTPGNLEVAPTSLAMNAQAGQQASPQTLTLQNNGGMYLDWTVNVTTADQGKWLSVTPGSGTVLPGVQSTITVHTDATALKAGSYQGTLTFAAGGLSKPVSIALTVTTPPVTAPPAATIMLQPTSLAFNTYKGSNPSPQTLKLTNSGNAPLNWSASLSSELTNAFTINPAQGSNLQPGNSTQITVNPNLAGNDVGTLSGTMTVVDSDSGSKVASQSASITVSILAQPQATISVLTNTLNFANTSTPTQQSPQQLVIQNTGAADLHWSITQSDGKDWLSLDNTSGTIAPGSSSSLVITCHTRHLPPGTYNAILTVYDSDANSSVVEQKVQVVLTVKG